MNDKECNSYSNIYFTLKKKEILLSTSQKNPKDIMPTEIS